MKPRPTLVIAAVLCLAGGAFGQTPYAGLQARPVKALSDQQIADLKAGRGMGMALPAELNGYPGPSHVLELADRLGLTAAQRAAVQARFDAMKAESIALGDRLIEREAMLDGLFAGRTATPENVSAAASAVAETQGELRATHLKYHLSTIALLQPEQIARYGELRGYGDGKPMQHRHQ
jgi:Spy/CpxP family protein refolding chaperone